ncbi:MAG: Ig-like domain-containing protein [Bacillota bacterium]
MEDGKNNFSNEGLQRGGKGGDPTNGNSGHHRSIFILLIAIIVLLAIAIIIWFTPIGEMVFSKKSAPSIVLEIVNGPELDASTGKYQFEVEAEVTGNPTPEVLFNRDDSLGEAGENCALILLDPGEILTLTAVASNSQGRAEDSLELVVDERDGSEEEEEAEEEAEEEEEASFNHAPVISGITLPAEHLFCEEVYTVSVEASDPDGDPLNYNWEITGTGDTSIADPGANPMEWTAPAAQGDYVLEVTVRDDRGGESAYSQTVEILPVATLSPIETETGFIVKDQVAYSDEEVFVGDFETNAICRGYISFDITGLENATVHSVELCLPGANIFGSPDEEEHGLWIGVVNWGNRPLELSDYNLTGIGINTYTSYDVGYCEDDAKLIGELQSYIDDGSERFQIRLHFSKEVTDDDDALDGVMYFPSDILLKVFYES